MSILTVGGILGIDHYHDDKNYVDVREYLKVVAENKDIVKELESVESKLETTGSQLIHLNEEVIGLNSELEESTKKIEELSKQLSNYEKKIISSNTATQTTQTTQKTQSTQSKQTTNNGVLKTMYIELSAYTAKCNGCSGITKTGVDVKNTVYYKGHRVIATDPNVIPMYSKVKVYPSHTQEPFIAYAIDTGGAIKGNHVDFLVESKEYAYKVGRQKNVKLEVLEWGGK